MSKSSKAVIALLSTVVLWSFSVIIARATVTVASAMTVLFWRMFFAAIAFLPFFIMRKVWRKKDFWYLIKISLLSSINIVFFMWGIQYTSASTSQLIYALIPILIVLIETFYHKIKHPIRKILGVAVGFAGILLIISLSILEKGETITGSITGNLAIVLAMLGWLFYILLSKKISLRLSPVDIGSVSILTTFVISLPLLYWDFRHGEKVFDFNFTLLLATLFMGVFGTFMTYLLYQYAIKYLSSLTASLSSYIQPVTTTILAMIFLGEKITPPFIIGTVLVFSGVFLTTTLEFIRKYKT